MAKWRNCQNWQNGETQIWKYNKNYSYKTANFIMQKNFYTLLRYNRFYTKKNTFRNEQRKLSLLMSLLKCFFSLHPPLTRSY
jgi:hypothetical protein